ncbi:hypothetical protein FOZ63_025322 [Perkinsus olseni]|uniref:Uncharacterized protein n=1 Tax=Perkinsus olseni TaxID=32597 RepID=A0A7J6QKU6_PEROL|nr:hypothetical protein FOZ63_025322 [Perkinsus olseni]KAF4711255.1 hypothetical protein FOZ62_027592 [Perkinsus olseni]
MSFHPHIITIKGLLLTGLILGTSVESATARGRRRVPHASPEDLPPGTYTSAGVPLGMGFLSPVHLNITYNDNKCRATMSVGNRSAGVNKPYSVTEFTAASMKEDLLRSCGLAKCYQFDVTLQRAILPYVWDRNGKIWEQGTRRMALCTANTSTTEEPKLKLYFDARRRSKNGPFEELSWPVPLARVERETSDTEEPSTSSGLRPSGSTPVRDRVVSEGASRQAGRGNTLIANGFYYRFPADETVVSMTVETKTDGIQYATITSFVNGIHPMTLKDSELVPDSTPGCLRLKPAEGMPASILRFCPDGTGSIDVRGGRVEYKLIPLDVLDSGLSLLDLSFAGQEDSNYYDPNLAYFEPTSPELDTSGRSSH